MDIEDEIAGDFLRMQGRSWIQSHNSENGYCDDVVTSPYQKKREEAAESNKKPLELNIQSGRHTKVVQFSLPKCLAYRENGMTSQNNFAIQVLRLKLRSLKLASSSRVDFSDYVNCYFIKGFKRDLIGAWTYHEYSATLLKSVSFQYSKLDGKCNKLQSSVTDVFCVDIVTLPNYKVFDICGVSCGDQDYVLYVANSYGIHKNIAHLAPVRVNEWGDQQDDVMRRFEHQEILWSCAWNNYRQRFAIGADRCIFLHDYESFSKKIDLPKVQPYSLDFNNIGNMLYCGIHSGNLLGFDLRMDDKVPALTVPLCKKLSYIKLLSNEQTVIASGFDSFLFSVDLRLRKPVFQYPNHYSMYKKLNFNLNESVDVLCAPGEDNITRLWSLKDGKLLHALPIPNQEYCGQINTFFEADGRRMFVHILMGDTIHTYETLEDSAPFRQVLQLNAHPLY